MSKAPCQEDAFLLGNSALEIAILLPCILWSLFSGRTSSQTQSRGAASSVNGVRGSSQDSAGGRGEEEE